MSTVDVGALFDAYKKDELIVLPEGTHRLEVKFCKHGDNFVMPTFVVVEGEQRGKRVLAGKQVLTEKSAGIFFQNMRGYGVTDEFVQQYAHDSAALMEALANFITGRVVDVGLTIDPYNGQDRNKIAIGAIKLVGTRDQAGVLQPAGGGTPAPAPASAAPTTPAPAAPPVPAAPAAAPPVPAPAAPAPAPAAPAPAPAAAPVEQAPAPPPPAQPAPEQPAAAPAAPAAPAGAPPLPQPGQTPPF